MKILILSIGNEVTSGHTVNTNASYIAASIEAVGLTPDRVVTMRDDIKALTTELRSAAKKYGVVIITGGLGPTHDDITKPALVKAFSAPLCRDAKTLKEVKRFFVSLDVDMPTINEGQADVPKGFTPLANRWGTAPGLFYDTGKCLLFALPGVPHEMRGLMENEVVPILSRKLPRRFLARTILKVAGIGESSLLRLIEETGLLSDSGVEVAFLPSIGQVDLRLSVEGNSFVEADAKLKYARKVAKKALGHFCYGRDGQSLEEAVGKLLKKHNLTLASAESCTGGLFASRITSVAGSSAYFLEGAVTYSDDAKIKRLKVNKRMIEKNGAVSEEVAQKMAAGIAKTAGADIGISATGIAGPGGGTKEKPVGLVYIGLFFNGKTHILCERYRLDRITNQKRTAQRMMTWLYVTLKEFRPNKGKK